ncbi:hypothetical protein [Acetivibrio saccincola]|jgi:hypothetical protein|nr:hypothetical protein [Acetivibrio saccincola]NLW27255.1 hypothetical protein [Acetivibrio saccincola]HOA97578.1 hypothetical protein [Acetivibrio saccincola]HQD28802.1 hypothetical protein [Acetivibrio saccincola]
MSATVDNTNLTDTAKNNGDYTANEKIQLMKGIKSVNLKHMLLPWKNFW